MGLNQNNDCYLHKFQLLNLNKNLNFKNILINTTNTVYTTFNRKTEITSTGYIQKSTDIFTMVGIFSPICDNEQTLSFLLCFFIPIRKSRIAKPAAIAQPSINV